MMIMIAVIVLSSAFLRGGAAADVTMRAALVAGNPFIISCGPVPDKGVVLWRFRNVYASRDEEVFDGSVVRREFFTVNTTNNGWSQLTKLYSNASDAGKYMCMSSANEGKVIVDFNLIILNEELKCEANTTTVIEGDYQRIHCRVNYTGDVTPTIEYQRGDGMKTCFEAKYSYREFASKYERGMEATFTRQMLASDNDVEFKFEVSFRSSSSVDDLSKTCGQEVAQKSPDEHQNRILYPPKS